MLSLRASDYLGPQVLCSKGEPGEEVRKVRSASEGRYEWPMSLPVEGAEPLPWFRPREPLYPPPAYQRYPRYTVPYRPFPEGLPFPAERPTSPPYYRGGSLKHRILHPPPSIRIVTVEAPVEHPFFVFNRGWSSCNPERSLQRYRLQCQRLSVGDVCISLTHRAAKSLDAPPSRGDARGARSAPKTDPMNPLSIGAQSGGARKRRWSAPDQVTTHAGLPMPQRTATT
ncbi:hypothetical protein IscW_ISCW000694 [Ixodes scapularis]|uniref:AXH domain-containing protein n=1 Tax=Ixodes scapularis TaxID=6945 RepID=B7P391_IXOSC|nr:hypothetical protein IscW_ISCW000694 [Ixodes scapularis]|eukprot:XP_002403707.1 hypothetical protein IscW_ISCW000694 [Ixodes scapularis]